MALASIGTVHSAHSDPSSLSANPSGMSFRDEIFLFVMQSTDAFFKKSSANSHACQVRQKGTRSAGKSGAADGGAKSRR